MGDQLSILPTDSSERGVFSLVFQRETSVTLNGPVEVSLDDRLR